MRRRDQWATAARRHGQARQRRVRRSWRAGDACISHALTASYSSYLCTFRCLLTSSVPLFNAAGLPDSSPRPAPLWAKVPAGAHLLVKRANTALCFILPLITVVACIPVYFVDANEIILMDIRDHVLSNPIGLVLCSLSDTTLSSIFLIAYQLSLGSRQGAASGNVALNLKLARTSIDGPSMVARICLSFRKFTSK